MLSFFSSRSDTEALIDHDGPEKSHLDNEEEEEEMEEEEEDEDESPVYDTSKIYFDENGNLRYDPKIEPFDRKKEFLTILSINPGDPKVSMVKTYILNMTL